MHSLARTALVRDRGFLAARNPVLAIPERYSAWDRLAADLPRILSAAWPSTAADSGMCIGRAYRAVAASSAAGDASAHATAEDCTQPLEPYRDETSEHLV